MDKCPKCLIAGLDPDCPSCLRRQLAAANERVGELERALIRLRDCDWTITLPDRMDAVRDIARKALGGV